MAAFFGIIFSFSKPVKAKNKIYNIKVLQALSLLLK